MTIKMVLITYCFSFFLICVHQTSALLIQSPPLMVKQPPHEIVFNAISYPFIMECEAKGEPSPTYRWTKNFQDFKLPEDGRIRQIPGTGTLRVIAPKNEDSGQYQCFAENEWGVASSITALVRNTELNEFNDSETITVDVHEGDPFKLSCDPPRSWPEPTISWFIESTEGGVTTSLNNSRITMDPKGNLWFSNVTREDAGQDFGYRCVADSDYLRQRMLGKKVILKLIYDGASKRIAPVAQYVTRFLEMAYHGKEVNIYCIFGGTPLPEIAWYKNEKILKFNKRIKRENFGRSIKIKNVSIKDEGVYTCEVSNGVGQANSSSVIQVHAAPVFTVEPEPITNAEDEDAEIRCEASGIPEPTIQWSFNGKSIPNGSQNDRRIVSKNSIIIKNLTKKDIGNYGCIATNYLGYVYKDVYINVVSLPPIMVDAPIETVFATSGGEVTLRCHVIGYPIPSVKWQTQGIDLVDGRNSVAPNGDLTIKDLVLGNSGNYTCFAKNKLGEISSSGILIVRIPMKMTEKPEDQTSKPGQRVTFRCNAVYDFDLSLHIEWLKSGKRIRYASKPRFVQAEDGSLALSNVNKQDSGNYTCIASTQVEEQRASAMLIVQD